MRQLLGTINLVHIITIVMLGLILAALIAGHFSGSAKGAGTTRVYRATANAPVGR